MPEDGLLLIANARRLILAACIWLKMDFCYLHMLKIDLCCLQVLEDGLLFSMHVFKCNFLHDLTHFKQDILIGMYTPWKIGKYTPWKKMVSRNGNVVCLTAIFQRTVPLLHINVNLVELIKHLSQNRLHQQWLPLATWECYRLEQPLGITCKLTK